MSYEKPPIGAAPFWFTYEQRILELSEAISRYSQYRRNDNANIKVIKDWATEIIICCDTYLKLSESEAK